MAVKSEDKKKKKPFRATLYSTKWLEKQGWTVANCEKDQRFPVPGGPRDASGRPTSWKVFKVDLFGYADLICFRPGTPGCLFVQTTSDQTGGNSGERIRKIAGLAAARACVDRTGNKIHVHAWKKKGPRGGAKFWTVKVIEITFDSDGMLVETVLPGTSVEEEEEKSGQKPLAFEGATAAEEAW